MRDYMRAAAAARFDIASRPARNVANDDEAAASKGATRRVAANDNPAEAHLPLAGNPKKDARRPRVSRARDARHLNVFNDFVPDARATRPTPAQAPSVEDTTPPSKTTKKRQSANENDNRPPPSWKRTTEIIKGHAYARTVSTRGGGITWTANFGGKVLKAANDNPKGLKERTHDRLVKALKASSLGAREFVFGIERTPAGRWHLHGIIDVTEDERGELEKVLRQVAGIWGSEHRSEKQVHTDVMWSPDGWIRYMRKDSAATRRLLGSKSVFSVTRGCRQRAEDLWEQARRQAQSHK